MVERHGNPGPVETTGQLSARAPNSEIEVSRLLQRRLVSHGHAEVAVAAVAAGEQRPSVGAAAAAGPAASSPRAALLESGRQAPQREPSFGQGRTSVPPRVVVLEYCATNGTNRQVAQCNVHGRFRFLQPPTKFSLSARSQIAGVEHEVKILLFLPLEASWSERASLFRRFMA